MLLTTDPEKRKELKRKIQSVLKGHTYGLAPHGLTLQI